MSEALKMCISFDPVIQFLGICPKVIKIHTKFPEKDIHSSTLYKKKHRKQPKYTTIGEKLNKHDVSIKGDPSFY